MLVRTLDDGIEISRVRTPEEAETFREGFVDAYRKIFRDPPYEEDFSEEEARSIYERLHSAPGSILLVATFEEAVVAFAAAVPLVAHPDVARQLTGIVPLKHTVYLVDLGVDPGWRRKRLARILTRERLRQIDGERYSHVVLRVAAGRTSSFELYRALDFKDTGVSMQVTHRRTDGDTRSDERVFLSRLLSQVHIDE